MIKTNTEQKSGNDFCPYEPTDRKYHGAARVVDEELKSLQKRRPDASAQNLTGIALSGGGIRSASFSLGVMQALARKGWLNRFDYLSTVSGGGYIGSSLTWLLHKSWDYTDDQGQESSIQFGLDAETFPFKTEPVWSTKSTTETRTSATTVSSVPMSVKGSMLRWLRQNGKYLTPGGCHNFAALVAVVLRVSVISILVNLSLLVLIFKVLNWKAVGAFTQVTWGFMTGSKALVIAGYCGVIFALLALIYSVTTFFFTFSDGTPPTGTCDTAQPSDQVCKGIAMNRYSWRRFVECVFGVLLLATLGISVVGVIPLIPDAVQALFSRNITTELSVMSTLAGIASSIGVFTQSNSRKKSKWMPVLVGVAVVLLLLGVLLLAYQIATNVQTSYLFIGSLLLLVAIGAISNLNYISLHRYYRDRLMETFMPNVEEAVLHGGSHPGASLYADGARIQDMYGSDTGAYGPYHLINTNIVLVESKKPKFKGRGGDNFILSPNYCGSNATGWCASEQFMGGGMTLATAMAISGAAVNPSAGCGGEGVTRQPVMSMLMGLLNIRLGYWTPNPNPSKQPLLLSSPNFIFPGLWELLLRKNLNEDSRFIQLTDGGHFENLGLYELIRRRLKVIVACDGGADPDFNFSDLANVIEKARVDFGTLISIECKDLEPLVSRGREAAAEGECPEKFAERGYLVADIHYADNSRGKLIYLTTTFTRNLSADLYGYRKEHPEFPDESTGDQFFDEKQFEAYRELGFQLAWSMFQDGQSDLNEIVSATAQQLATQRQ